LGFAALRKLWGRDLEHPAALDATSSFQLEACFQGGLVDLEN
jgi:hypothetical protein